MRTKSNKILSILICITLLFVAAASLFYLAEEINHSCTGENCPVCANMHQAEQTLKNLGTGVIANVVSVFRPTIILCIIMVRFFFVICTSLVSQKVRIND